MKRSIGGVCLCGRSTYKATAEPVRAFLCYCVDCQRQTGSAFSPVVVIGDEDFHASGDIATFIHSGGSGSDVARSFCMSCGSPLFSRISSRPALVYLKVGTMRDAAWVAPEANIFVGSAPRWACMDEKLPSFERTMRR